MAIDESMHCLKPKAGEIKFKKQHFDDFVHNVF